MRKWFARFFILLGFFLIIGAVGLVDYNLWEDHRAKKAAEVILEEVKKDIPEIPEDIGEELYKEYPEKEMPVSQLNGNYYLGILDIPRLGLSLPVMDNWNYSNLNYAPCRYSGNVYLDNMVICGHNYNSHFGRLTELNIGDRIYFTDAEGHLFEYYLDYYEVIQPTDIEYMIEQTEDSNWDLSLFTCTLSGGARCTFRCKRI